MLRVAEMLIDCGISRRDLAARTGIHRSRFTETFAHERFLQVPPGADARFRAIVEHSLLSIPDCGAWLTQRNLPASALWDSIGEAKQLRYHYPKGHGAKVHRSMGNEFRLADPLFIETKEDIEMLNARTMKYFKLFTSPFTGELKQVKDIYQGEEHIFLREMMLETARNAGFTAVSGECGCGKSIMRKVVAMRLISEGIKVVFPVIVDKARITPSSLIDAIIMDISEESPKRSLEAKTRQAYRLLKNRAASGMKQVLIIEEAHLLSIKSLKCLKQIHELENGFDKLIGIILLGQPELKYLLDEAMHPELREVIRRCTMAEITDLGGEVGSYLKYKFDRVAAGRFDEIFEPDCITAVLQRLPDKAFPLSVNNLAARSMNLAAEMGEAKVTAEVVLAA